MNLKEKINQDIILNLKAGNKEKLESLRFLMAQIKDKELEMGRKELDDEKIISLIKGLVKKNEESISFYKKANRQELIAKCDLDSKILKGYLPKMLSDEELEKEIKKLIISNPNINQPGPIIGMTIQKLGGKADSKKVSQIVLKHFKK
ncbi:glutamyl-tRNA amidotransferase [Candidatus Beckwithbacteria bacterium CG10_big_fil_rev_8_21_14_0_10_34_10]|uniref:Glutamyl-tRNA amidotransferase n=1 Tax=Candidatus Beckwithbacteria bacterium CG10_big_fil_rev_8_21_14_0_10_34_10 TaxID=1974495 RepID=A0A2H0WAG0_9BACT|nr:MAG: glutamyl-tRNA amidotransferase [Candidatus Beckwithbacteria bacterium CG10_big_fil_rev_8_21_14_0_10_34_10]